MNRREIGLHKNFVAVVACVFLLNGIQLHAQDSFVEMKHVYNTQDNPEQQSRLLHDIERQAKAKLFMDAEQGEPFHWLAIEYHRKGDYQKCLSLMLEVTKNDEAPIALRIKAWRIVGQMNAFRFRNIEKAKSAYAQLLDLNKLVGDPKRVAMHVNDALSKLAWLHQSTGEYKQAIYYRSLLINKPGTKENKLQRAYLENARDFTKLKEYNKASAAYKEFFAKYPNYGLKDGKVVHLKLEQIDAIGLNECDPKRINLIKQIWEDPQYRDTPDVYNLGRYLVSLAEITGDIKGSFTQATNVLEEIEQRFEMLTKDPHHRRYVDQAYIQCSITLAERYQDYGDFINAISVLRRLKARYPNMKNCDMGDAQGYTDELLNRLEVQYSKLLDILDVDVVSLDIDPNTRIVPTETEINEDQLKLPIRIFLPAFDMTSNGSQIQVLCVKELALRRIQLHDKAFDSLDALLKEVIRLNRHASLVYIPRKIVVFKGIQMSFMNSQKSGAIDSQHGKEYAIYELPKGLTFPISAVIRDANKMYYPIKLLSVSSKGLELIIRAW